MKTKLLTSTLLVAFVSGCWLGISNLWPLHPDLAQEPSVRNHINPGSNDYVPLDATDGPMKKAWHVLDDYSFFNPCTGGPEGNIYCSAYKDPLLGQCNLIALDYKTGQTLWTDADSNGGSCLLDEYAFAFAPLVDREGRVYTADSQRIVSFDSAGNKLWDNNLPQTLTTMSGSGRVNMPFGFNMLTTGELVAVTLGDGFLIVLDRATGNQLSDPLDIPGVKLVSATPFTRPTGHLEKFGGVAGADAVWDSSFADAGNENDNDVSTDRHTDTIYMIGAAEGPNNECETPVDDPNTPCGDGKLWAMQYDSSAPGTLKTEIVYSVRTLGPGGSATTPAVSNNGQYVVFGNADGELVVADNNACLSQFAGITATAANNYNECSDIASYTLPNDLLASPTVTPGNVIMVLGGRDGVIAIQISRVAGVITLTEKYIHGDDLDSNGLPVDELPQDCGASACTAALGIFTNVASVITAFKNVTYVSYLTLEVDSFDPSIPVQRLSISGDVTPHMLAFDTLTGDLVQKTSFLDGVGDFSNVTLAPDRKTLLSNNFNFVTQIARDRLLPLAQQRGAGLDAWVPQNTELAAVGHHLSLVGNVLSSEMRDIRLQTPAMGRAMDPQLHGANVTIFNPISGENQVIDLPKENWVFVMGIPGFDYGGYHYIDVDQSEGPCSEVIFTEARINVACDGPGITYTLDEATQDQMGIAFSISPAQHFCGYFGGADVTQDIPGDFQSGPSNRNQLCVMP